MAATLVPDDPPSSAELLFEAEQLVRRQAAITEQVKLQATFLNTSAAGTYVTGVLAPLVQSALLANPFSNLTNESLVLMLLLTLGAFIVHALAVSWLGRLL